VGDWAGTVGDLGVTVGMVITVEETDITVGTLPTGNHNFM